MSEAELHRALDAHFAKPFWAIVGTTWYHVARVVEADGKFWELYWHPSEQLRSIKSKQAMRARAKTLGVSLAPNIYRDAPSPRKGSEIVRVETP